jgi:chemotaxis-related protein WspD
MEVVMDDCWNRIGVRGDASCAELATCAHCRNCPVYSAAAARLLDRALTADRLDEATRDVARPADEVAEGAATAIVFRIGAEWFALSPLAFDEIVEPLPIRALPHRRGGAVLGLVSVRGELLVCLSLARVIGLADTGQPAPCGRLIVVSHVAGRIAFPVDEVCSIHAYQARELKELPATVARTASNFADGLLAWSGRVVGRLDGARLADVLNRSVA